MFAPSACAAFRTHPITCFHLVYLGILQQVICEHDIGNIFCACQDGDNMNYFAYITRELDTERNYCHVFCVPSTVRIVLNTGFPYSRHPPFTLLPSTMRIASALQHKLRGHTKMS